MDESGDDATDSFRSWMPYVPSLEMCLGVWSGPIYIAHRCQTVLDLLHKNGICVIFIPSGCTGERQPLDISVNDYYKKQLKNCFYNVYASKIQQGTDVADISVDLRTSVLKPVHARWFIKTHVDKSCLTHHWTSYVKRTMNFIVTWKRTGYQSKPC